MAAVLHLDPELLPLRRATAGRGVSRLGPQGPIAVYGRTEGLAVYELIGCKEDIDGETAAWIASYEEGLSKYRQRDFPGAITHFEVVLRARPYDRPASLLFEHSKHLERSGVAEDWQAISTLKTK